MAKRSGRKSRAKRSGKKQNKRTVCNKKSLKSSCKRSKSCNWVKRKSKGKRKHRSYCRKSSSGRPVGIMKHINIHTNSLPMTTSVYTSNTPYLLSNNSIPVAKEVSNFSVVGQPVSMVPLAYNSLLRPE